MRSIFNTPLLTPLLRTVARFWLRVAGWKVETVGNIRPPCVFIGAPHTSNWDLLLLLVALLDLEVNACWLGKHTLFRFPFGGCMRWLGGRPVVRNRAHNQVSQSARLLKADPDMMLCLAPEGTRKKVERWKTGFYHIAVQAEVPIVMAVIDAEHKSLRILGEYRPTGDIDKELAEIQRHYRGYHGLRPENAFEIPTDH